MGCSQQIISLWVVGKSGYGWTRTQIILKYTFTFTKQLFFIPTVVSTSAFASRLRRRSCHNAYPFISACVKDRDRLAL